MQLETQALVSGSLSSSSRVFPRKLTPPSDQGRREPAGPYPPHTRALGGRAHTEAGRERARARRDHRGRGADHDRHPQPAALQDASGLRHFGRGLRTVRGWLADAAACGGCSGHGPGAPSQRDTIPNELTSLNCQDIFLTWNRKIDPAVKWGATTRGYWAAVR